MTRDTMRKLITRQKAADSLDGAFCIAIGLLCLAMAIFGAAAWETIKASGLV